MLRILIVLSLIYASCESKLSPFKILQHTHQPPTPPSRSIFNTKDVTTGWFTADLDNFNETDTRKWQMRFLANDKFFIEGGPLFIVIGAEWEITPDWILGGNFYDIARQHNAFLVYTEHRYYGQSRPTNDMSFENLKYLNVDQALDDLAKFIVWFKSVTPGLEDSKVIVMGGSYAGSMAVWMRQQYPDIVTGSWASGAPLLAKVNFYEYKEHMGYAFKSIGGQACYNRLEEGFTEMERLIENGNVSRINDEFNLCSNLDVNNKLDVWSFFDHLSGNLGTVVQYHFNGVIEYFCGIFTDPKYDGLTALAEFMRLLYGTDCLDTRYDFFLSYYGNITWGNPNEMFRQYFYQTCIDFGYYKTSDSEYQPFGKSFPLDLYLQICADAFDKSLTKEVIESKIDRNNQKYGGLSPNVTNVYFTHGDIDPWSVIGVRETQNEASPVIVIPNYGHCFDMQSISDRDSEAMKKAKLKVWLMVEQWLKD